MINYPHTVTVGENFGDAIVEITVRFTDAAIGIGPLSTLGEALASPNNNTGRAVRATLRDQLAPIVDKVSDAVWTTELAADNAADLRRQEREKAAVQAAKDETAKMLGDLHDCYKHGVEKAEIAKEAEHAATIKSLNEFNQHLQAELRAAKATKRSTAAKAGHMRKARGTAKAGRK